MEKWGSAPLSVQARRQRTAPAGHAWSPRRRARPGRWTPGSDGPSHGEVTGRLGGVSSSDLQASTDTLWGLSRYGEWAVWPPVFSLTASSPRPS